MSTTPNRLSAWAYLRCAVRDPHADLIRMLWPDGDMTSPARVIDTANAIRERHLALPKSLRVITEATVGQADAVAAGVLAWCDDHGARLITPDDAEWPTSRLVEAFGPSGILPGGSPLAVAPFALFATGSGSLADLTDDAVTVTGNRSATRSTCDSTRRIVRDLATAGLTIVSSGSLGADTVAHTAALSVGSPTLVVAASGLGRPYPASNVDLFSRIGHTGLFVTEYLPTVTPSSAHLIARQRLIAALSPGTVVTAAGIRSGVLAAAGCAEQMGRPVMILDPDRDVTYVADADYGADRSGCQEWLRKGRGVAISTATDVQDVLNAARSTAQA